VSAASSRWCSVVATGSSPVPQLVVTATTLTSLIETCKRLRINLFKYLKEVLTSFPSAKTSEIDDFLRRDLAAVHLFKRTVKVGVANYERN
jgi:IS66 C-terminal element